MDIIHVLGKEWIDQGKVGSIAGLRMPDLGRCVLGCVCVCVCVCV